MPIEDPSSFPRREPYSVFRTPDPRTNLFKTPPVTRPAPPPPAPSIRRSSPPPVTRPAPPPPTVPFAPQDAPPPVPHEPRNQYATGFVSGALTEPTHGGSGGSSIPFALSDGSNVSDGLRVRVLYGYVRDVLNGANYIPTGMSSGDDPPYFLSVSGSGEVFLNIDFTVDADTGLGTASGCNISSTAYTESETQTAMSLGTFSDNGDGTLSVFGAAGFQGWMWINASFMWVL